jgi:hypothetical protein
MSKSYLNFIAEVIDNKCQYQLWNDKHEHLGRIQKMQVGQWQSWCLFLNPDCYMSASCLDEVREKIRCLNNNKLQALKQVKVMR